MKPPATVDSTTDIEASPPKKKTKVMPNVIKTSEKKNIEKKKKQLRITTYYRLSRKSERNICSPRAASGGEETEGEVGTAM